MTIFQKDTWKKLKLPNKNQLVVILLVGMLIVVIAIPTAGDKKKSSLENDTSVKEQVTNDSYRLSLEKELEQILQDVEGVGTVKVMLTMKSSTQKIVEKDINMREDDEEQTTVFQEDTNGTQTPYISKELTPEIAGVVVIASGGDNAVTIQNITEAIQALFNVDTHKIKIMKLKS